MDPAVCVDVFCKPVPTIEFSSPLTAFATVDQVRTEVCCQELWFLFNWLRAFFQSNGSEMLSYSLGKGGGKLVTLSNAISFTKSVGKLSEEGGLKAWKLEHIVQTVFKDASLPSSRGSTEPWRPRPELQECEINASWNFTPFSSTQ